MEGAVSDLPGIEVRVSRVHVEGLNRTKSDIVVEQVKDVLAVKNLSELLSQSYEAAERLNDLNIFKNVTIVLDTDKARLGPKRGGSDVGGAGEEQRMEVTFLVKEKRRISASLGAEAGTQSGEANASMFLRNLLGRGEKLEVASSTSFPHWGQTLQLQFTKPYYKDLTKKGTVEPPIKDTPKEDKPPV